MYLLYLQTKWPRGARSRSINPAEPLNDRIRVGLCSSSLVFLLDGYRCGSHGKLCGIDSHAGYPDMLRCIPLRPQTLLLLEIPAFLKPRDVKCVRYRYPILFNRGKIESKTVVRKVGRLVSGSGPQASSRQFSISLPPTHIQCSLIGVASLASIKQSIVFASEFRWFCCRAAIESLVQIHGPPALKSNDPKWISR